MITSPTWLILAVQVQSFLFLAYQDIHKNLHLVMSFFDSSTIGQQVIVKITSKAKNFWFLWPSTA